MVGERQPRPVAVERVQSSAQVRETHTGRTADRFPAAAEPGPGPRRSCC